MISSKELIDKTGISRATMNNYIALGILPKPVVRKAGGAGERTRSMGYFPDDAVDRVALVRRLKKKGLNMNEVAARIGAPRQEDAGPDIPAAPSGMDEAAKPSARPETGVKLTLDRLEHPAYMVNYNFFVEWCNEKAARSLFGLEAGFDAEIEARSLFKLLLNSRAARAGANHAGTDHTALLTFQLSLAKIRMSKPSLGKVGADIAAEDLERLEALYDEAEPSPPATIAEIRVNLAPAFAEAEWQTVYASFFREGILFVHQPAGTPVESFLDLLSRRDRLIRDVIKHREPVLTPVCALVANLHNSTKICADLPPEEYFELVNQVWQTCETVLRKHHVTQGKYAGKDMVSYFFPQPDCNYLLNALLAADELRRSLGELSREWQLRKQWENELYLNIGLSEGEEWFGAHHSATNVEFTVLGDTINHAARLSEYARDGALWVTKKLIAKLAPEERQRVRFGIRRINKEGRGIWMRSTYSRLSDLIDLENERGEKFRGMADLAIAEVEEVVRDEALSRPRGR